MAEKGEGGSHDEATPLLQAEPLSGMKGESKCRQLYLRDFTYLRLYASCTHVSALPACLSRSTASGRSADVAHAQPEQIGQPVTWALPQQFYQHIYAQPGQPPQPGQPVFARAGQVVYSQPQGSTQPVVYIVSGRVGRHNSSSMSQVSIALEVPRRFFRREKCLYSDVLLCLGLP